MSSVAIGVMTVEERGAHCARLVERVGGRVHVYLDRERRGCWHGWRSTWDLCVEPGVTHVAILADDIAVCADFRATLNHLAAVRPSAPIAGWLPRDQVELAHAQGLRWACTRDLHFVQCLMLPREMGAELIAWVDDREPQMGGVWGAWDDERIRAYLTQHAIEAFVPVPNICDHLGGDGTIASTFGHRFARESARSRVWLGERVSGAGVDWSNLSAIGDQPVHPYSPPRILLTAYNVRDGDGC